MVFNCELLIFLRPFVCKNYLRPKLKQSSSGRAGVYFCWSLSTQATFSQVLLLRLIWATLVVWIWTTKPRRWLVTSVLNILVNTAFLFFTLSLMIQSFRCYPGSLGQSLQLTGFNPGPPSSASHSYRVEDPDHQTCKNLHSKAGFLAHKHLPEYLVPLREPTYITLSYKLSNKLKLLYNTSFSILIVLLGRSFSISTNNLS